MPQSPRGWAAPVRGQEDHLLIVVRDGEHVAVDAQRTDVGMVRLALLPDDGPTAGFFSWDGTAVPW